MRLPPALLLLQQALTIGAAAIGGALFFWLGLPAPWLSGAMVGVALAIPFGLKARLATPLRDLALLMTGMGMGAAITPAMLADLQRYPLSLVGLGVTVALNMGAQYVWLTRRAGWDPGTAIFAAAPGALSALLASAAETKVDVEKVVMVQCCRIFFLMALLPTIISGARSGPAATPPLAATESLFDIGLVAPAALFTAWLFTRWGVTAPVLFGGMVASALLHGTGEVHGVLPAEATTVGFVLIGAFIGQRFAGLTGEGFRRLVLLSTIAFAISMAVSVAGAETVALTLGMPFAKVLGAYAPGALEAMVSLSSALAFDPLYASAHHVARFLAVSAAIPFLVRFARRHEPAAALLP